MSRTSADLSGGTVTFRIAPALKAEFAAIARGEAKPVGEVLRELVRERVERARRCEFEAEERRQSVLLAEAARDPNSEEAQILREPDTNFDEFARDLAAREKAAEGQRARKWK